MKYLYPYECETVKLSDPQELQMAIDSNKRDRRHSDTIPLLSGDNPAVMTTQAMQLINSPTVQHATSGSPYPGGFLVATPTGQLVQLPQVPGVPIVMPHGHGHPRSDSSRTVSEDGEDENSSPREPPTKRMAMEANQVKVAYSADNRLPYVHTTAGNFIMTHGGTPIVAHPSIGAPHHIIQMAAHHGGHIPIVIPTPTVASSTPSPLETTAAAVTRAVRCSLHGGDVETVTSRATMAAALHEHQRRTISVVNGPVPVAAIQPQATTASATGGALSPQQQQGLLTMPGQAIHSLIMAPSSPATGTKRKLEPEHQVESVKKPLSGETSPVPTSASLKMPIANISIQSGKRSLIEFCHSNSMCLQN